MNAELRTHIISLLDKGTRLDGRGPLDYRKPIKVEYDVSNSAEGSAQITIGETIVMTGIKMSLETPYPDTPDAGNLMVGAELLPMSNPEFETGPPGIQAIEIGRVVDRGIRESKLIDTKKLCIEKGEKVWTVFIDIYSINDDGNLMDAAGIGAISALKDATIPKYDKKEEKIIYGEKTKEKIPLSKHVPISITVHKIGKNFLVDPTREEEDISETRITVGSSDGIISSVQKGEESSLKKEELDKALDMCEKIERDVFKKIEKFLK